MVNIHLMGLWIRRFLLEYMIGERNLTRNTQASYRDTFKLLLPFVAEQAHISIDKLTVEEVSPDRVRSFLLYVEKDRSCSIHTRNQRLSAVHALARFIAERCPDYVAWCGSIRAIPFKKTSRPALPYLEKSEMDAVLDAPDCQTAQGRRDYALLLFLYNTGARADEAAHVKVGDLDLRYSHSVKIAGKGRKDRICPLWALTIRTLDALTAGRSPEDYVFLNRKQQPLTRFGVRGLVKRHVLKAIHQAPSLKNKNVSSHTIRHTAAVHLLRGGVDINTIRGWLGHVSVDTTNIYAETDLEMKAKALAHCEIYSPARRFKHWRDDKGLMDFLKGL